MLDLNGPALKQNSGHYTQQIQIQKQGNGIEGSRGNQAHGIQTSALLQFKRKERPESKTP